MSAPEASLLGDPVAHGHSRDTTVLFAGIVPAGRSPESDKQGAVRPTTQCLAVLGQAVALSGGRVVKSASNEVMALFNSPDAAAIAAARMQAYVDAIAWARPRFSVRIGFHSGPVAQRDDDIFGDTVNLALQLLDEAKQDQILTSEDTASRLGAMAQALVRPLPGVDADTAARSEVAWKDHQRLFGTPTGTISLGQAGGALRLNYRGKVVLRRRQGDTVTIGRDPDCGLGVHSRMASRKHCSIERLGDRFVLRDHSMNGTFITVEGAAEQRIHGTEFVLSKRGWIAFGEPRSRTEEIVQYNCTDGLP